jgi:signal transduction histidine kinase
MLAAMVLVTALAWWDEQREADAALVDLQSEQSVLATSLSEDLREHLTAAADAGRTEIAPSDLVDAERRVARPGELLILVKAPGDDGFHATDGRTVASTTLLAAFTQGAPALRLAPAQAAELGLPARTSMAGIAHVDAGKLGHWGVVSVASAARERDREKRARWRLVLGVVLASGLVLAFGGAALRRQRKGMELQRELAVANAQRERDDELQRAERVATMGTFAMGIAHEVATPLGVIVGRAEQLVTRAQGDERTTRNAQAILGQADRIQHIVRRFLDMARGGPPSLERVDPGRLVRDAAASVEHRFAKANVKLRVDVPPNMPAIHCDRDLLDHAIVNLLLNACEACEPGGHVELAARSDAEQVAFVVTDDGAGISSEAAARAKEPFFTTKPQGIGTGLGLAIATEIVKSHRGELTIGPNPSGKGTRALIEIPIASNPGAAA